MNAQDSHHLGEEIARVAAQIDSAEHTLLTLLRRFDEERGWSHAGALSCVTWLGWRVGLAKNAAGEKLRVANALGTLPRIDEALRTNQISYSKARALTRVGTPDNEEKLLSLAIHTTAQQLEKICRTYRKVATPDVVMTERWVRQQFTGNGMVRITAQLTVDEGAVVMNALEAAREALGLVEAEPRGDLLPPRVMPGGAAGASGADPVTPASVGQVMMGHRPEEAPGAGLIEDGDQPEGDPEHLAWLSEMEAEGFDLYEEGDEERRQDSEAEDDEIEDEPVRGTEESEEEPRKPSFRWAPPADALVFMAERFLAGGEGHARTGGERATVMVHLDSRALAEGAPAMTLEDGSVLSAESFRRVACDAGLVAVLEGPAGKTLDVGRKTRAIPTSIQRALRRRDGGCRFPGCSNDVYVHAHHVKHWTQGGETRMANLVTVCSLHHRLVHEGGFGVKAVGDGFRFTSPEGRDVMAVPARPRAPGNLPRKEMPWPKWDGTQVDMAEVSRALFG